MRYRAIEGLRPHDAIAEEPFNGYLDALNNRNGKGNPCHF
jgi:hypothetical protein